MYTCAIGKVLHSGLDDMKQLLEQLIMVDTWPVVWLGTPLCRGILINNSESLTVVSKSQVLSCFIICMYQNAYALCKEIKLLYSI